MGQALAACVDLGQAEDIRSNADPAQGEVAAGWVYHKSKRGELAKHIKGDNHSAHFQKPVWGVLKGWPHCTLSEYEDRRSIVPRTVTFLLKCTVRHKGNDEGMHHFNVHHSNRGSLHLYCKSEKESKAWEGSLGEVIVEAAAKGGIEGYLKKRGGFNLHSWQRRWFQLIGNTLSWRDKPTDSFPKSSITLSHLVTASLKNGSVGGEAHVFTINDGARHDAKKVREFACETLSDAQYWVHAIETSIETQADMAKISKKKSFELLQDREKSSSQGGPKGFFATNNSMDHEVEGFKIEPPNEISGWYQKQNSYGLWYHRQFVCSKGEIRYYKDKKAKGACHRFYLGELVEGSPSLSPTDDTCIYVAARGEKTLYLKLNSKGEAENWLKHIKDWKGWLHNDTV